MCGGTGKLSDAVPYLRGKMLDVMSDRNRYKSLHDAMRADATIGVAALPLIRDALLATDDETTLDAVRRLMSTLRSLWNERDTLKAELAKAKSDLEISESFTAMRERAEKAELKRDTYKAELAYHIGLPHCASITDLEKRLKEAEHIVAACKAWREYAAVEAAQGGCVQFVTMKMLAAILRGHKPLEQT
jgi:chromosome segregation ATPase